MNKETSVKSKVAIPLSKKNKTFVTLGCCFLMAYISAHGTALAISQSFLLTKLDAMGYFSLSAILISLGTAIMTPIGGKLGDIVGRRKLIVISSIVAFLSTIGIAYSPSINIYLISNIINSLAKGAFVASPYILLNLINEKENVPKAMGLLASSVAGGSFLGAIISGLFNDMGNTELGMIITGIFILLAGIFIFIGLPNTKSKEKIKLDLGGIILLTISISSFVLTLNFGPELGWTNFKILLGFLVLIVSTIIFVKYEKKVEARNEEPIIAISLFKNKEFTVLLLVGLICYFYQSIMTNYGSLASLEILGESATKTGLLTLPRMLLTFILPTITGIWVSKNKNNSWKAMALASGIVALAFIPLIFISPSMPISILFISFSITGIAESFRAVSITPAAQEILDPKDLSTGTALVNFINTLASVLSPTIGGAIFNANGDNIVKGISSIFICTVVISFIGLILVLGFIKKYQEKRYITEATEV